MEGTRYPTSRQASNISPGTQGSSISGEDKVSFSISSILHTYKDFMPRSLRGICLHHIQYSFSNVHFQFPIPMSIILFLTSIHHVHFPALVPFVHPSPSFPFWILFSAVGTSRGTHTPALFQGRHAPAGPSASCGDATLATLFQGIGPQGVGAQVHLPIPGAL